MKHYQIESLTLHVRLWDKGIKIICPLPFKLSLLYILVFKLRFQIKFTSSGNFYILVTFQKISYRDRSR